MPGIRAVMGVPSHVRRLERAGLVRLNRLTPVQLRRISRLTSAEVTTLIELKRKLGCVSGAEGRRLRMCWIL